MASVKGSLVANFQSGIGFAERGHPRHPAQVFGCVTEPEISFKMIRTCFPSIYAERDTNLKKASTRAKHMMGKSLWRNPDLRLNTTSSLWESSQDGERMSKFGLFIYSLLTSWRKLWKKPCNTAFDELAIFSKRFEACSFGFMYPRGNPDKARFLRPDKGTKPSV